MRNSKIYVVDDFKGYLKAFPRLTHDSALPIALKRPRECYSFLASSRRSAINSSTSEVPGFTCFRTSR